MYTCDNIKKYYDAMRMRYLQKDKITMIMLCNKVSKTDRRVKKVARNI